MMSKWCACTRLIRRFLANFYSVVLCYVVGIRWIRVRVYYMAVWLGDLVWVVGIGEE